MAAAALKAIRCASSCRTISSAGPATTPTCRRPLTDCARACRCTWFGPQQATLTLTPGGSVPVGVASFGPFNFDITAQVALANDGAGSPTDACEALVGVFTGRIVLADRGTCAFALKARTAQDAGAVGIIIANNVAGATPPGLGGTDPLVTIGALSILRPRGVALKASLAAGPVTARMFRLTGTERDGALDNTIIAHEWGHYIHHRLADCGQQQCSAMSEGWGDFIALHTIARDGDNLNGTYALATYATSAFDPNSACFGIRRVPCSVDVTKNAFTFKHISDGVALPRFRRCRAGRTQRSTTPVKSGRRCCGKCVALQKARVPARRSTTSVGAWPTTSSPDQDGAARCNLYRTAGRHSQRRGSA